MQTSVIGLDANSFLEFIFTTRVLMSAPSSRFFCPVYCKRSEANDVLLVCVQKNVCTACLFSEFHPRETKHETSRYFKITTGPSECDDVTLFISQEDTLHFTEDQTLACCTLLSLHGKYCLFWQVVLEWDGCFRVKQVHFSHISSAFPKRLTCAHFLDLAATKPSEVVCVLIGDATGCVFEVQWRGVGGSDLVCTSTKGFAHISSITAIATHRLNSSLADACHAARSVTHSTNFTPSHLVATADKDGKIRVCSLPQPHYLLCVCLMHEPTTVSGLLLHPTHYHEREDKEETQLLCFSSTTNGTLVVHHVLSGEILHIIRQWSEVPFSVGQSMTHSGYRVVAHFVKYDERSLDFFVVVADGGLNFRAAKACAYRGEHGKWLVDSVPLSSVEKKVISADSVAYASKYLCETTGLFTSSENFIQKYALFYTAECIGRKSTAVRMEWEDITSEFLSYIS